jgi:TOMM system kinase/cyclase fusion protein
MPATPSRGWYKGERSFGSATVPWEFYIEGGRSHGAGRRAAGIGGGAVAVTGPGGARPGRAAADIGVVGATAAGVAARGRGRRRHRAGRRAAGVGSSGAAVTAQGRRAAGAGAGCDPSFCLFVRLECLSYKHRGVSEFRTEHMENRLMTSSNGDDLKPTAAPEADAPIADSSVSKAALGETIEHAAALGDAKQRETSGAPKAFGRYQVRSLLGKGGFGAVYCGYDSALQREVAIKVPYLQNLSADTEQEFLQEARQLAQLKHPGIVTVFDVGVDQGTGYIVTDYLKGQNLAQWLKHHAPGWQETVRIVAAIGDALDHAHAQRMVHRDIKPANIILVDGERPVVVDFGLAISDKQLEAPRRGTVSGTPAFLSPEQTRGEGHRIDGRTDIYSLGVLLYCMLTSRLPFQSVDLHELFREIQEDDPQPPRQLVKTIPRELESICLKALSKRLKDRYTTAGDMVEDLRRLSAVPPVAAAGAAPNSPLSPQLTQPTPPPHPSSQRKIRAAERRRITVWQCGCEALCSAPLLEALDPEEQHELLLEIQALCREVAEKYRGAVVKTTDHGLQLCFGFPIAYEDAAPSAVRAGLEVLERLGARSLQLQRDRKITLSAAVAIHTDLAVVQEKDHDVEKLSIVGSVMSVVDQLESLAQPDTVLISEDTHHLIKGHFECSHQGTKRLKGVAAEKQLYRVVNERTPGSRIDVTGLTPLIGRDREVGLLQERWEQAAEGIGQVVLLIGEAGIGKSRLVHGLKEFVVGQNSGNSDTVVEWRTSPHHQNSSLYPAIECFEHILNINRQMSAAEKLDRLVTCFERLGLGGTQPVALMASLLSIPCEGRFPSPQLSPQHLKEKTLDLMMAWLRELARRQAVLFIVEDLHWADPTTLEFLEILLNEASNERQLTLCTFRPDFVPPWRSRPHVTQVALHRLTKRQIAEMMLRLSMLKSIPQRLIDQVAERTEGVPLFVEEFTAMVLGSGKVRAKDGVLEVSESFPLQEIPATLQDMLMARLDRMACNIELVQLASALGREFSHELLQAVSPPQAETALQGDLIKLIEAELFLQRGRTPNAHYQFKHALIQDAAYQSLLKKRRLLLHHHIGQVLEAQFPDTCTRQPELVAHHFNEAGEAAKALEYLTRAGARAMERGAHQEAIRHLTRALELIRTLPDTPERRTQEIHLHISLGVPLQATLGYSAPEVEANYTRAHELCLALGLTVQLFAVLYGLFRYSMLQAKYNKALQLGEQLRVNAEQAQSLEFIVAAHRALGATCFYRGETARALTHLETVLAVEPTQPMRTRSYRYDVVDPWVASRSYLAWVLWLRGDPDAALGQAQAAITGARELEHPFSLALACSFASWLYQFRHEVESAAGASDEAIAVSKERGYQFWIGWAQVKRGWILAERGQLGQAVADLTQGLKAWRAHGSELGSSYYLTLLAEVYGKLGQIDDALKTVAEARRFAEEHAEGFWLPEINRIHGELLLLHLGNAEAEVCFEQAIAIARLQEAKSLELRAVTSLARLWIKQGKAEPAREMLTSMIGWFQEGLDSYDLRLAKAMLEMP